MHGEKNGRRARIFWGALSLISVLHDEVLGWQTGVHDGHRGAGLGG